MHIIIGNILGWIATVSGLVIYLSTKRSRILTVKIVSDSLFAIHEICLNMLSGAVLHGVAICRSIVFYNRGRHKWADSIFWLIAFLGVTLISPIMTWQGPISLLPAIGSIFCVFAYYVKNTVLLRILSVFGEGLWLIYGLLGGSLQIALFGVVALLSIALGTINELWHKQKEKKYPSLKHLD